MAAVWLIVLKDHRRRWAPVSVSKTHQSSDNVNNGSVLEKHGLHQAVYSWYSNSNSWSLWQICCCNQPIECWEKWAGVKSWMWSNNLWLHDFDGASLNWFWKDDTLPAFFFLNSTEKVLYPLWRRCSFSDGVCNQSLYCCGCIYIQNVLLHVCQLW